MESAYHGRSIDMLPVFFGRTHGAHNSEAKISDANREARRCSLSRDSIESCSSLASTANHGQQKREQDLEFEINDAIQIVEDSATRAVLGMMMNYLKEIKTNIINKIDSQEKMQKNSCARLEESVDAIRKWTVGWKLAEEPEAAGDGSSLNARLRQRMSAGSERSDITRNRSEIRAKASQPLASGQPSVEFAEPQSQGTKEAKMPAENCSKKEEPLPQGVHQEPAKPQEPAKLEVSSLPTWLRLSHMPDKVSRSSIASKDSTGNERYRLGVDIRPQSQDFESSLAQARKKVQAPLSHDSALRSRAQAG